MLSRANAIEEITAEPFDVIVIGGGVTGAGVALDAASRGYSVALLERDDYAIGTSSRSSKMVHGGLRYLQNFDLGLVREALLERQLMVQLAPHLVYPTPYLVPTVGDDNVDRLIGIGLNMYDVMATTRVGSKRQRTARAEHEDFWAPDRHRTISAEEAIEFIPALEPLKPKSAYMFYDCQTDDVRLVLTILGEAERYGAVMANGIDVTSLIEENGKVTGVRATETESGEEVVVRGEVVVNATGVFADRIRPDSETAEENIPRIAPSRGSHVTLDLEKLPLNAACVVPAGAGRTIFALPWYGRALIGTTDNDYDGDIYAVEPGEEDIDYLLDAVNNFFKTEITRADLTGAYAGVRPLISTGDPKNSVDISRRAELYETASGMLTITGGKLTTWRRMAEEVVDRIVEREAADAPCRTAEIPLGMKARPQDLEPPHNLAADQLPEGATDQLAFRYGHAARNVLAVAAENPDLAGPIVEGRPDMMAEVVIAARDEQARNVADVLLRRTRLGLLAAPQLRTPDSVMPVAEALGAELGWSKKRIREEAKAWPEAAAREGIDPALAAES